MQTTGVKLDPQTRERLQVLGVRTQRSPHWLMKAAIEKYLQEQEAYWREREEDAQRWQAYQRDGGVSHTAVAEWLDSIGTQGEVPCPR